MSENRIIKNTKDINMLAEFLSKCDKVTRFDQEGKEECGALAFSLHVLEISFRNILDDHLPKLMDKETSVKDIGDIIFDIGEEIRQILLQIKIPKSYRYLLETLDKDYDDILEN